MKRLVFVLSLLALMVAPLAAMAQEPGSGGPIIQGNGGTSVGALNYIRCAGTDCRDVTRWLAVGLLGLDEAANYVAGPGTGALAESWEVNEDNTVFTFHLRSDMFWSDGEQIDANDVQFAYYAYANADAFESPYSYVVDAIESLEVVDPQTVVMTMKESRCDNLGQAALSMVPSHAFGWEDGQDPTAFDWASLINHPYDTEPSVSGGPFVFDSMTPGERVVMTTNESYADGPVVPEGWLYITVPDQTVMAERFIAGDLNVMDGPQQSKREEMRENADLQTYDFTGNSWDYMALNQANPDNPQNGVELDAEGNPVLDENGLPIIVEQEDHPLFADVRVRQALQHGINLDEIMEKAVFGEGTQMFASQLPTSWAIHPELTPRAYDLDAARALLDEAGWVATGDPLVDGGDGLRTCQGCGTAEEGTEFVFELLTNAGNTRREQIGELVQDQLAQLGVQVDFVAIDFNQLLEIMDAQTFDAYILGWSNSFPPDPDQIGIFDSASDIVGSGFNTVSFTNPEVDRLLNEGLRVPGCAQEDRAPYYHQIQEILHDEQPYLWLFATNGFYAASANIENWLPAPNQLWFNATEWAIAQ